MFGLTLEKLFLIAVITAVVVGLARLPDFARRFAQLVRALRSYADAARSRAEQELGIPLEGSDWGTFDPRRYDPRRIVRQALEADADAPRPGAEPAFGEPRSAAAPSTVVVVGTSGHPRRPRVAETARSGREEQDPSPE